MMLFWDKKWFLCCMVHLKFRWILHKAPLTIFYTANILYVTSCKNILYYFAKELNFLLETAH